MKNLTLPERVQTLESGNTLQLQSKNNLYFYNVDTDISSDCSRVLNPDWPCRIKPEPVEVLNTKVEGVEPLKYEDMQNGEAFYCVDPTMQQGYSLWSFGEYTKPLCFKRNLCYRKEEEASKVAVALGICDE